MMPAARWGPRVRATPAVGIVSGAALAADALGCLGEEPVSVHAVGSYYLHERVADVTTTHLVFPGGERAHVFVSWLHPFTEQKLVVVGSAGMAVFDDSEPWASKLVLFKHRIDWRDGMRERGW